MIKSKNKPETEATSNEHNMDDDKNILHWNKEDDDKSRPVTIREILISIRLKI